MLKNKLIKKLYACTFVLILVVAVTGCERGLVFEEAPEGTYSEVTASRIDVRARQLFTNQIYAINWDKWVDNYLNTQLIGASNGSWTNKTGAPVTLSNGVTVAAIQNEAVKNVIAFGYVGLEVITAVILVVLLSFLNVEKDIDKKQEEIKER